MTKIFATQKEVDEYRNKTLLKEGERLTNYDRTKPVVIGDASFEFDYRRDTFEFKLENGKYEYLGVPKNSYGSLSKTFLTNSGQAAIHASYIYIDKFLKLNEIESHNDYLYVGAYRLQDLFKIKHSRQKSSCLWVCSTSTKFEDILKIEGSWDTVIVDTTCWCVGSEEIEQVYDKFKSVDLLILFRSHSKLDMGGVEYGSLGNLTIFCTSETKLESSSNIFKDILGLSGGYAILDEIPPYLFNEDFFISSKKRVQKIIENTKEIQSILLSKMPKNNKYGEFIFPDHYKYFFLRLYSDTDQKVIRALVKRCTMLINIYLPEAKSCASFGFNFPSLTFYLSDEGIGHFFRFSTGIISQDKNEKLALCIQETFGK